VNHPEAFPKPSREELMAAADEAGKRSPIPTTLEEYSYAWAFCMPCNEFSALSKKHGDPFVCACGWSTDVV